MKHPGHPFRALLFDLDGTLLDTASDLLFALNQLRGQHSLPPLPISAIRPLATFGSKMMVKIALGIEENHPDFNHAREQFFNHYEQCLADSTQFFPNIDKVLIHFEQQRIPWGIVTNKPTRHTHALLKALSIEHRPACIICGDSLPTYKPDPAPILYACQLLGEDPKHCLYIGDAATDVIASKRAGTKALVALYGYIHHDDDPFTWKADGYIDEPLEIIEWVAKYPGC